MPWVSTRIISRDGGLNYIGQFDTYGTLGWDLEIGFYEHRDRTGDLFTVEVFDQWDYGYFNWRATAPHFFVLTTLCIPILLIHRKNLRD